MRQHDLSGCRLPSHQNSNMSLKRLQMPTVVRRTMLRPQTSNPSPYLITFFTIRGARFATNFLHLYIEASVGPLIVP